MLKKWPCYWKCRNISKTIFLIEGGSLDRRGIFIKTHSEKLEYEFGFSAGALLFISNPELVFDLW